MSILFYFAPMFSKVVYMRQNASTTGKKFNLTFSCPDFYFVNFSRKLVAIGEIARYEHFVLFCPYVFKSRLLHMRQNASTTGKEFNQTFNCPAFYFVHFSR